MGSEHATAARRHVAGDKPAGIANDNLVAEPRFFGQGVDYIGFLNAKLRDLRGWSTLLNELVQNADDSENTSYICFDVRDDALVVENDGLFSDCGQVEADECAFGMEDERKCCDFHAFRRVASGHKRIEANTTGAFGLGFVSAYQITDKPILESGTWRWQIRPDVEEARRIEAHTTPNFTGTRFQLPWAKESSVLRRKLGLEPVDADVCEQMCVQLRGAMERAAPFLRRLNTLELKRNGVSLFTVQCERDNRSGEILIQHGDSTSIWLAIRASFSEAATELRRKYPGSIDAKKNSDVVIAIPGAGNLERGRLYVGLPTEHEIELPILINADFFPSSDRKRVLFDSDYQGEWNRAVIRASAEALSAGLLRVRDTLEPDSLWNLLRGMNEIATTAKAGRVDPCFASFWQTISPIVREGPYVRTSVGSWTQPAQARLLESLKEQAPLLPLLESLGLQVVSPELQPYFNLLRNSEIGVAFFRVGDLTEAMKSAGLDKETALQACPQWLRKSEHRSVLGPVLEKLLEREAKEWQGAVRDAIGHCSLILSTAGTLCPPVQQRLLDPAAAKFLKGFYPDASWAASDNPKEMLWLLREFSLEDLVGCLAKVPQERLAQHAQEARGWAPRVIDWINARRHLIVGAQALASRLRALHIWPCSQGLASLDRLSVPGDFEDPLALASMVEAKLATQFRTLLTETLAARQLTFEVYVEHHLPRALENHDIGAATKRRLFALLLRQFGEIARKPSMVSILRTLPVVECQDGVFRKPGEVYFESELVRSLLGDAAFVAKIQTENRFAAEGLLKTIGVREHPAGSDVVDSIASTCEAPLTARRVAIAQRAFATLGKHWTQMKAQHSELQPLKSMRWLPAENSQSWHSAQEIYGGARKYLFETTGRFLSLNLRLQQQSADFMAFLGLTSNPPTRLVVAHLLNCAKDGRQVNAEVYGELERKAADPDVLQLRNTACLQIAPGQYVNPARALWRQHHFGTYRVTLPDSWRRVNELLKMLGVKEEAAHADATQILVEVSSKYSDNRMLDDSDLAVVMACWTFLGDALGVGEDPQYAPLDRLKIIPNRFGFLKATTDIYFEDRPGLVQMFGGQLDAHVISRPERAWRAMALAGVQALSAVAVAHLVECDNPTYSALQTNDLKRKWSAMRRVFAAQVPTAVAPSIENIPEVWLADRLVVLYRLGALNSPAESVAAFYSSPDQRLYQAHIDGGAGDVASARELVFGILPDASAGALVATVKDLLHATDEADAHRVLDAFGIPDVDLSLDCGTGHMASDLVADESPATEEVDGETSEPSGADDSGAESGGEGLNNSSDSKTSSGQDGADGGHSDKWSGAASAGRVGGRSGEPRAKLRSYVQRTRDNEEERPANEQAIAHRQAVDIGGINAVIQYERQSGRDPEQMEHTNEGYDIASRDSDGHLVRYIEVKSLSSSWDGYGVGLSPSQFSMARLEKTLFWLYVVENADSDSPVVHAICDPASQVVEYRFDDGWLEVEEKPDHAA